MRTLLFAAIALLTAACAPVTSSASNGAVPAIFVDCWASDGNSGAWLENRGDKPITVRYDLSSYSNGMTAIGELDKRRWRETGTYQHTLTIGPMQEALVGMIPAESMTYSDFYEGYVYGADAALTMVIDTPQGRVSRVIRNNCR